MSGPKTPWVVVDAVEQVFKCTRCGGAKPLREFIPSSVEQFVELSDAFCASHQHCADVVEITDIKGMQLGVRFVKRAADDPHICIQLLIEDDDCWHNLGSSFSTHWLDELDTVIQRAKEKLKKEALSNPTGAYLFKTKTPEV